MPKLFRSLAMASFAALFLVTEASAQFELPPIPELRPKNTSRSPQIDSALGDLVRPSAKEGDPLFGSFIGVVQILNTQDGPQIAGDVGGNVGVEDVTTIQADDPMVYDIAVLRTLDKITARMSTEEVFIDDMMELGNLRVTPRRCLKNPPTETPESSAFLEIYELPKNLEPSPVFQGWMFASSPALNAMEHPVFDVWLLDCKN
jgi:hypothetical protein